jgi:hypothetical protein
MPFEAARAALLKRLASGKQGGSGAAHGASVSLDARGERDWDASTCVGSDDGSASSTGHRRGGAEGKHGGWAEAARDVLKLAPQLRDVHSARSVRGIIARQEGQPDGAAAAVG